MKHFINHLKTQSTSFFTLFLATALLVLVAGCDKENLDKLTGDYDAGSAVDVSSRITAFQPDITGAGATVVAVGSNLSRVKRVFMDDSASPSVVASENEVTFKVPIDVGLGEKDVIFIFEGNERASKKINVVPLPVISNMSPLASFSGDEVVIIGSNLNYVEQVMVGAGSATITEKDVDILAFTLPAEAATGDVVTLVSPAGNVNSLDQITQCDSETGNLLCSTPLNTNGSFEDGELGVVADGVAVPAWGFSGSGSLAKMEVVNWRNGETRDKRKALRVEVMSVGANPWNIEVREESFPVTPSTNYLYTILAKGPSGARVDFTVGLPNYSELGRLQATMSGNWETYTIEFTTGPDDNMIRTPIHFSRDVNIGMTFYLDNLRIVPKDGDLPCTFESDPVCFCEDHPDDPRCGTPPINMDGGFEDSELGVVGTGAGEITIPGWGFSGTPDLAKFEVVDDEVFSGSRALKVDVLMLGANPWNIEIRQENIPIEPLKTYVYSIRVKGDAGEMHFTVGNPNYMEFGRVNYTSFNGEWQEVTYEFTPGADDTILRTPIHASVSGNEGKTFYLDDLKITPKE